jgi:alcohol dehydrogenase
LNALLGAQLAGARTIIAIDVRETKFDLAGQLGATSTFSAALPDCVARIRDYTAGGVDYAFEMAGSTAALELAWAITRRGGQTVTAGLPHPDKRMSLPALQLVGEERTLRGSYLGSCVPVRDIPAYVSLYRAGRLPVDRLMSQRIGLTEINGAFDRLADGETIRQIVVF